MYERAKFLLDDDVLPLLIGLLLSLYTIFRWVSTVIWVVNKVEPRKEKIKLVSSKVTHNIV